MGLSTMSASDADLVLRARQGDLRAYAELVGRHRGGLQRYAHHLLGNHEEAEEALQDALLRAHRALAQCAHPDRFRSWLLAILINRCRTRLARPRPLPADGEDALDRVAAVDDAEGSAWREEIARALAALPADHREAFLLKHVEEFSYEEMAALTGASVPALKMRVSRACERLRHLLAGAYRG
jgi:RNA polymerase sigma-70 factor (ECF subfamily)